MSSFRYIFLICLAFIALIYPRTASAEESITISGSVLLPDGETSSNTLVILNPGGYTDTTAMDGSFSIGPLPDDQYEIDIIPPHSIYRRYHAVIIPGVDPVTIRLEYRSYAVDEIVVVAPRSDTVETTPAGVSVVNRDEFGQSVSVAEAIKSTPGARMTSMGGIGAYSELSLRGSNPNQVRVYLDGMPLNDANGGSVDLGAIPLAGVERIEVWRSGSPTKFGGDASGGAISIITREPNRPYAALSAGYGSHGYLNTSGIISAAQDNAQYLLSAEYLSSDNNFRYESDNGTALNPEDDYSARRSNNAFRSGNLLLKYRRIISDGILFELSDHATVSRREIPALQHSGVSSASLNNTRNYLKAEIAISPSSWIETAPSIQYHYSYEHYRDQEGSIGWGMQDNTYVTRKTALLAPTEFHAGEWGMLSINPIIDRETFSPNHRLQETLPLACDRNHTALVTDAALTPFGSLLTLTGTIRRDRYDSSFEGSTNQVTPVTPVPTSHYFTNREAAVRLQPLSRLSLRMVYGDVWREPGFSELFGDRGITVSRPGLKPEQTIRREMAARFDWEGLMTMTGGFIECARFTGDYRNMIQWYVNSYGFVEPDNVTAAAVDGTELIWRIDLGGVIRTTGTWTFQRSEVINAPRSYHEGKELPGRPHDHGNVRVELPWDRFTMFCLLDRKGSYYLDRANQEHKRYPGRSIYDAGCMVPFERCNCSVSFGVSNLTDVYTFDYQGMPKPGRSYMVSVDYSFNTN